VRSGTPAKHEASLAFERTDVIGAGGDHVEQVLALDQHGRVVNLAVTGAEHAGNIGSPAERDAAEKRARESGPEREGEDVARARHERVRDDANLAARISRAR